MTSKLLGKETSDRTYVIVFETDDDVSAGLQLFLTAERIEAAKLWGIGGFRRATYQEKPRVHAHCVVGHRDGRATGGHFLSGTVRPTLELMVEEIAAGLRRTDRPEIGIPLLAL